MDSLHNFVYQHCSIHPASFCHIDHFRFCLGYIIGTEYSIREIMKELKKIEPTIHFKPDMEIIDGIDLDFEMYHRLQCHLRSASSTI